MNLRIQWTDELLLGIDTVDAEHKALVGRYNGIIELLEFGVEPEEIAGAVKDLVDHTERHFSSEEGVMDDASYPRLRDHRTAHEDLLGRLNRLMAAVVTDRQQIDITTMSFVRDWLVNHMLDDDAQFGRYMQERVDGEGAPAVATLTW